MKIKTILANSCMAKAQSKGTSSARKQILPGIQAKTLKPVAALVDPQTIVVPMVLTGIISQISDNLKDQCSPKEVQQMESVKSYSKCLGIGNSRTLSATHALANTLGPEASTLATLSPDERLTYLADVRTTINTQLGPAKVNNSAMAFTDPEAVITHRRGLALQARSNMQAAPVYSRNQITIGMPVKELNLETCADSAKQLWVNIGREADAFDNLLLAQVDGAQTVLEAVTSIVKQDMLTIFKADENGIITLGGDVNVLKGEDNLTPIERNLGFITRTVPEIPSTVEITPSVKLDPMLQAALDQQKKVVTAVSTSLQKAGKTPKSTVKPTETENKVASKTSAPSKGSRGRRSSKNK